MLAPDSHIFVDLNGARGGVMTLVQKRAVHPDAVIQSSGWSWDDMRSQSSQSTSLSPGRVIAVRTQHTEGFAFTHFNIHGSEVKSSLKHRIKSWFDIDQQLQEPYSTVRYRFWADGVLPDRSRVFPTGVETYS